MDGWVFCLGMPGRFLEATNQVVRIIWRFYQGLGADWYSVSADWCRCPWSCRGFQWKVARSVSRSFWRKAITGLSESLLGVVRM